MALSNKGCFMINGVEYVAKSLTTNYESLVSEESGRTLDGVMHVYWVKRRVRKISIELPPTADRADIAALLYSVQGQEYDLTYWDAINNTETTIRVYTSNSKSDFYSGVLYNGVYQGITFNAIELAGE